MITAQAEAELRAVAELARGCEKSHGKKQTALLFSALADRLDNFIEQHGETAWRMRTASNGARQ
ncbi:hypothetical protein FJ959_09070 [Mesorhizobium sp. B2-2-4]|uniref:hypothetical protein n=1 Tax=unclassified Mesorhizobium TaxID=325217 RepID=UPI001125DF7D|nr:MULTISPECIES: hypothetical protein [unclassified Mesorhizobium]TPM59013.1 hypothetical protein FJ959_09070 [Mesorhizobium sp. B2-2-4]TPM67498.1 hypothetical protein FJ965_10210 [Mesorhizobium sp. B2-2-1]